MTAKCYFRVYWMMIFSSKELKRCCTVEIIAIVYKRFIASTEFWKASAFTVIAVMCKIFLKSILKIQNKIL